MEQRTTIIQQKTQHQEKEAVRTNLSPIAITVLALVFAGMLALSSINDYLFFGWLAMGSSIVFALVGIHILGKQQVKRN